MHRALAVTMAAMLWGAAGAAHAQEGAEEIPPPPPSEEVPAPPPGYGQQQQPPPQQQAPAQYPPQQGYPQQGYPQQGGYYPPQQPPQPPVDPGRHTHDGFFLRATLGPAFLNAVTNDLPPPDDRMRIYGGAIAFTFAIGGAVAENLVIFGELFATGATSPNVEIGDADAVDTGSDTSLSYGGLGAGVTYFIMPINLYLSGSISLASLELQDSTGATGESGVGFGLEAIIGKEWWVSDNWGLGPAIQVGFGSVPDSEDVTFGVFHIALHFSATYN